MLERYKKENSALAQVLVMDWNEKFVEYAKKVYQGFAAEPELALGCSLHGKLANLPGTAVSSVPKLLDTLEEEVAKRLNIGKEKQ